MSPEVSDLVSSLTLKLTVETSGRVGAIEPLDERRGIMELAPRRTISSGDAERFQRAASKALESWRYETPAATMAAFVRFESGFSAVSAGHLAWCWIHADVLLRFPFGTVIGTRRPTYRHRGVCRWHPRPSGTLRSATTSGTIAITDTARHSAT